MDATSINLVVRFLLELGVLASLGYWGAHTGKGPVLRIVLCVGAPLFAAIVWGTFGSPKAAVPLSPSLHLLLEVIMFGGAALALYTAGRPTLATVFIIVAAINRVLMYLWNQ
jgi:hypothetical protein